MNSTKKWASLATLYFFFPSSCLNLVKYFFSRKVTGDSNISIFEKPFLLIKNKLEIIQRLYFVEMMLYERPFMQWVLCLICVWYF